ncbi:exported protein of unknown function [Hyphomicrobium sp. MC1]|nr:exported protein of unknown function [Hyphomicrobium sp. MC1]
MTITAKTLPIAGAAAALVFTLPFAPADAASHKAGGHSSHVAHSAKTTSHAARGHSKMASGRNFKDGNARHVRNGHRGHGNGLVGLAVGSEILSGSGNCGYSYRMWQSTGSRYWRSRYYDCAG